MKSIKRYGVISIGLVLSACGGMPSECEKSWEQIEKLAKESGIPQHSIDTQKKQFEEQIKSMSKQDAMKTCQAQSSVFGVIK